MAGAGEGRGEREGQEETCKARIPAFNLESALSPRELCPFPFYRQDTKAQRTPSLVLGSTLSGGTRAYQSDCRV